MAKKVGRQAESLFAGGFGGQLATDPRSYGVNLSIQPVLSVAILGREDNEMDGPTFPLLPAAQRTPKSSFVTNTSSCKIRHCELLHPENLFRCL